MHLETGHPVRAGPPFGYFLWDLAYQECEKAAKEKGMDQTADINCIKFLMSSKKDCWPCICQNAKRFGWKIRGCDPSLNLVQEILRRE